tara:strand:- start:239 stop:520 length:282 start_codon:yes stop_codon:yes gene_type:complete
MNKVIKLLGENPNAIDVLKHLGSSSVYNYLNTTRGGLELLLRSPEFQNLEKTCNGKSNPIEINLRVAISSIDEILVYFNSVTDLNNIGNEPDE